MKRFCSCFVVFVMMMFVACSKSDNPVAPPNQGGGDTSQPQVSEYLTKAKETHDFVINNLLTSYNSYRVNITTNTNSAFEWYTASQLYADAAMVMLGDTSYLPYMNKTFKWLDNLWDKTDVNGGYFAFANLDGSGSGSIKYVDDNSLTGVIFLEAYNVTSGSIKQEYLNKAKA